MKKLILAVLLTFGTTTVQAGYVQTPYQYSFGGTNNSSSYTQGSIVFANSSSLSQDNSKFFWDDSAFGLRVGTNAVINASAIEGVSAVINATTPTAGVAFPFTGNAVITGDTAQANTTGVYRAAYSRTITTTAPTENEVTSIFSAQAPTYSIPAGQTLTNTSSVGYAAVNLAVSPTISGGGALAFTNWQGLSIAASSVNTGSYKNDIKLGAPTGATNNAYIADNSAYSGSFFINAASTNPSVFAGSVAASNLSAAGHGSADILAPGSPTEGGLLEYTSGAWSNLAVGTNGQCLTSNGTDPVWGSCAGSSAVTTVGALDGNGASANGATISGNNIYMQSASASNAGLMTTAAQTFAGAKTFNAAVYSNKTVVNGGNTAYTILATDQHVRSGTTLTAQRTYTLDACTTNIGEQHEVKHVAGNAFTIVLAGNGGDTIDGSANVTLNPGDSYQVICAASGKWDLE